VQHAEHLSRGFPWRTATIVVAIVAAVELVALLGIAATRLAAPVRAHAVATASRTSTAPTVRPSARHVAALVPHALRPRARLSVLVLNASRVNGAAGAKAMGLQTLGYGTTRSANAPPHNYARSLVMYVPGYAQEARRLGRDTGVRLVALLDGMRRAQLKGSQLVVVLAGS
jgi:LytR cell envelope-related transcriptional attenuator